MTRDDIETLAWQGDVLPAGSSDDETLYFYIVCKVYDDLRKEALGRSEARSLKTKIRMLFERVERLEPIAKSNTKLVIELNKLTAPRADLVKMDKEQLLNVIHKMEGLVCGLIKSIEDEVPEFLKQEVT
ncbi:MAG: hypothetical protein IKP95_09545 [Ruminococcus sp.]|nr:hypothetical protein [Ruminococcus sp.]